MSRTSEVYTVSPARFCLAYSRYINLPMELLLYDIIYSLMPEQ
jgi:hypothetical protein